MESGAEHVVGGAWMRAGFDNITASCGRRNFCGEDSIGTLYLVGAKRCNNGDLDGRVSYGAQCVCCCPNRLGLED